MSDVHDRNKTNCHASASVKSEIRASSGLNCEMIYQLQFMSNDRDKVNETTKIKNCGGGLNASQSPPPSSIKESGCRGPLMRRV